MSRQYTKMFTYSQLLSFSFSLSPHNHLSLLPVMEKWVEGKYFNGNGQIFVLVDQRPSCFRRNGKQLLLVPFFLIDFLNIFQFFEMILTSIYNQPILFSLLHFSILFQVLSLLFCMYRELCCLMTLCQLTTCCFVFSVCFPLVLLTLPYSEKYLCKSFEKCTLFVILEGSLLG